MLWIQDEMLGLTVFIMANECPLIRYLAMLCVGRGLYYAAFDRNHANALD